MNLMFKYLYFEKDTTISAVQNAGNTDRSII